MLASVFNCSMYSLLIELFADARAYSYDDTRHQTKENTNF
jgi:hypothetical protein